MAGDIKSEEGLVKTQTRTFIGNMQDYSQPSIKESLQIARKWLSSGKMPNSTEFKELALCLEQLRRELLPSKLPTELTLEELNFITEDRTLELWRTFSLRTRCKLFNTRFPGRLLTIKKLRTIY